MRRLQRRLRNRPNVRHARLGLLALSRMRFRRRDEKDVPGARGARPKLEARLHLHALEAVAPARLHGRTDKRPGLSGRARQAAEGAKITTGISRRVFAW